MRATMQRAIDGLQAGMAVVLFFALIMVAILLTISPPILAGIGLWHLWKGC